MSQQINLFNPIFLKQKKYFSALTMAQGLCFILLGSLALSGYTSYQVSRLGKQVATSGKQLAAMQARFEKAKTGFAERQKSKELEDEVRKAEADTRSLQLAFDTLQKGEFGNPKGYSEYLVAFSRQIIGGLWLTGFSIRGAGADIGLQGRALQPEMVPEYIARLKNEPVMKGKSFSMLEMQVPLVEQGDQASTGNPPVPKRAPASYIEFSLQSAAGTKDGGDGFGMKSK